MSYLDNAKRLIAEPTPEPKNKIIEQVRYNSYTLLSGSVLKANRFTP